MDTDTHWSKSTAAEKSIPNKSETEFGKCGWPKTGMMMKKQWESGNDMHVLQKRCQTMWWKRHDGGTCFVIWFLKCKMEITVKYQKTFIGYTLYVVGDYSF